MSILEDIKASWMHLKSNFLKILTATIGSIGLILIPVFVFSLIYAVILMTVNMSPDFILAWTNAISLMTTYFVDGILWLVSGPFVGIVLASVALFACLFSAVYILSGDIVTGHFSTAVGAIMWLRNKFLPLTATCLTNILVAVAPALAIWYWAGSLYEFGVFPYPVDIALGLVGFVWLFVVLGFLQLHVPAIIDNMPIIEAMKRSVKRVRENFKHVFGIWFVFVVLILVWFIPFAFYSYSFGDVFLFQDVLAVLVGGIALVGLGLDFLFFIPMLILSMTKIHHDIKIQEL